MKAYLSPYKVFDLSPAATQLEVEQYRGRILMQLTNYGEKDTVHFNSTKMAKEVALQLLTELNDKELRSYHLEIFNNKKLLNFLEYGHLNYFRTKQPMGAHQKEGFYQFIAPYFADQYSETLIQAIKTQDTETLQILSKSTLPIVADFEDQCYRHANRYVQDTINTLKSLQKKFPIEPLSERQLMAYLPNKTIELYNMLPDYFFVARNLIGNEVYQAALVMSQQFGRNDSAAVLVRQGLKLRLDTTVRQNLQGLLDRFKLRYKVPNFMVLGIAAVLLLFLIQYLENTFFAG
ncbi:MAG: hypothetical protein ACRBFS_04490 [Aureispira sp.]